MARDPDGERGTRRTEEDQLRQEEEEGGIAAAHLVRLEKKRTERTAVYPGSRHTSLRTMSSYDFRSERATTFSFNEARAVSTLADTFQRHSSRIPTIKSD